MIIRPASAWSVPAPLSYEPSLKSDDELCHVSIYYAYRYTNFVTYFENVYVTVHVAIV